MVWRRRIHAAVVGRPLFAVSVSLLGRLASLGAQHALPVEVLQDLVQGVPLSLRQVEVHDDGAGEGDGPVEPEGARQSELLLQEEEGLVGEEADDVAHATTRPAGEALHVRSVHLPDEHPGQDADAGV